MRTVGMIGLGLLGSALAERFLAAGRRVVGYDLSFEAPVGWSRPVDKTLTRRRPRHRARCWC